MNECSLKITWQRAIFHSLVQESECNRANEGKIAAINSIMSSVTSIGEPVPTLYSKLSLANAFRIEADFPLTETSN